MTLGDCMSSKSVLVVDDNDFDRQTLVKVLNRKSELEIYEATNGDECLEFLKTRSVDIILMDIMMPGTFGTQILMKIREKFNPIELPIIMVTSKVEASDIAGCLHSGANDYITKPINYEIALSRITTHLNLAQLSKQMSKLKEMSALDAMITTYNHEINNPLTIALGCLNELLLKDEAAVIKLKSALWRLAEIVKQIRDITNKKEAELGNYYGAVKYIKIK